MSRWAIVPAILLLLPGVALAQFASFSVVTSIPQVALDNGLKTKVFSDNFCSSATVDVNNTGGGPSAGFKWGTNNAWTNSAGTWGGLPWNTFAATRAVDISFGTCSMRLAGAPSSTNPGWLVSAIQNGATWRGYVFTGDFYASVCLQFDPALGLGTDIYDPGMFSFPLSFLISAATTFAEIDYVDIANLTAPNGQPIYYTAVHDWKTSTTSNINSNSQSTTPNSNAHCYGTLWLTAANHGGTGTVKWYKDNTLMTTVTYTSGAPASPGATPSNPNGTFFDLEGQQQPLILETGGGTTQWPTTFTDVEVWCASTACMTVQN